MTHGDVRRAMVLTQISVWRKNADNFRMHADDLDEDQDDERELLLTDANRFERCADELELLLRKEADYAQASD